MKETKREYLKRIHLVLDFIEKNLESELSLKILSEKAHYSPYHFHRVFLTVVGERLNEFIHRKRIERIASILLVKPDSLLIDLAYKFGFKSDNSFSRSFKKYYGISPTKFKIEGKQLLSKIGIEPFSSEEYICSIEDNIQWIRMNAEINIQELANMKLAGISNTGDFTETGKMYQKLMKWGHQNGVISSSKFKAVTIYHDNPIVTEISKVRFSVCITIDKDIKADGVIRPLSVGKGTYAIGQFEIKAEEIPIAWKSMCVWIIEKGLEFRDGDYFETYHNDHTSHPEQKFILDICIPIEKTRKVFEATVTDLSNYGKQVGPPENSMKYHDLIKQMKELRAFFNKEYDTIFKLGNIYQGNPDFSYFSLTTEQSKKLKLKYVIILNHKAVNFSICLSGQNKSVRKKYWTIFHGSDWNKYHLAESIDNSLSILDQTIIEKADFDHKRSLIDTIEKETLKFIDNIEKVLS